jgi:hypothetical protein
MKELKRWKELKILHEGIEKIDGVAAATYVLVYNR